MTKARSQNRSDEKYRRTREMRLNRISTVTATALLGILGGVMLWAQGQGKDKYSLISPDGVALSEFRGYEDWSLVSSARTDEVLKVIVANPTMIKAFKSGSAGDGHFFPEGSK